MSRARKPAAPVPFPMARPEHSGPLWHEGRSFYSCGRCCARAELGKDTLTHPLALDCAECGGTMLQWTPPAVKREREAAGG